MAEYFEETVRRGAPAKTSANWILGDFSRFLNADHKEIQDSAIKPEHLHQLIQLVDSSAISGKMAKQTFEEMYRATDPAPVLEKAKGSTQISGDTELDAIADQVIAENEKSVADFKAGKEQALKFLIGQAMKISKGRANPQRLDALLRQKITA
jgi:aspartyl-tRNA(Asn)/glutamyl-tRNA(Gln) amidotransferase subunit B